LIEGAVTPKLLQRPYRPESGGQDRRIIIEPATSTGVSKLTRPRYKLFVFF
jgi:hypothetical protein